MTQLYYLCFFSFSYILFVQLFVKGIRMTFNKKSRKSCQGTPKHPEKEGKCINLDLKKQEFLLFPGNSQAWCFLGWKSLHTGQYVDSSSQEILAQNKFVQLNSYKSVNFALQATSLFWIAKWLLHTLATIWEEKKSKIFIRFFFQL